MKLQIVCRGSNTEGLGHLFRTRTFARTAQQQCDIEVIAIVEPHLTDILSPLACPVHCVSHDHAVLPYVHQYSPDALLFDMTWIDPAVFAALDRLAPITASLSPVFDQMPQVDILFTRVRDTAPLPNVRVYAGLEYAIFNDHGAIIDDETYARHLALPNLPIGVCMGGADASNKTLTVLQTLVHINSDATFWVLLGEGYAHSYNALVDTVHSSRHEVILAKTSRSMWRVLSNCVLAILSGGLTTIEAVYAGLPTINILERREHFDVMRELFEREACLYGGDFTQDALSQTLALVETLDRDRTRLQTIRQQTRNLVDTRGSERILQIVQQHVTQHRQRSAALP